MAKGLYGFLQQLWRKPETIPDYKQKLMLWRKQAAIVRVEKPTRLDKARRLGYKAKRGFVVVRVRVKRGGHKRPRPRKGRKVKNLTINKNLKMNYRWIAEQRAARAYRNLEVLNSYWVGKDGQYYYYEVLLVDPNMPEIKADKDVSWIIYNRGRAFRGLTSAARKARGLRAGKRASKVRPSLRAKGNKGK